MMETTDIPVDVTNGPHWRVNFRPDSYDKEVIPTLNESMRLAQQSVVQLRGWDYPHVSGNKVEQARGQNWVASWADFMGHVEYWRLFQSGQFLHLFKMLEATEAWRDEFLSTARGQLIWGGREAE